MSGPKCGTYAGVSAHYKSGDLPVCEPCKAARRAYMLEWRHRTGQSVRRLVPDLPDGSPGVTS